MTLEEFHEIRKPLYIDSDTVLVKFPTSRHMNVSHAEWFTDFNIPWLHTIRGYLWETENHENDFITLYVNNYAIPNISCTALLYLFEHFPHIKHIGLGCHIGSVGEVWEPQLKVTRTQLNN